MALLNNYDTLLKLVEEDKYNFNLAEAIRRDLESSAIIHEPRFMPIHHHNFDSILDNYNLNPEIVPDKNEDEEYLLMTNILASTAKFYIEAIRLLKFEDYIKISDTAYNVCGNKIPNMKALLCKREAHKLILNSNFYELESSLQRLDKENK